MKEPAKVFVCSVADLFAEWTKPEWRDAVIEKILDKKYSHLTFQLLTKQPQDIPEKYKNLPANVWVGATITGNDEISKMHDLVNRFNGNKFLSFEPLLEQNKIELDGCFKKVGWVIIGKLTGSKKVQLNKRVVEKLVLECQRSRTPLFLKDNLGWPEKIQEFPKSVSVPQTFVMVKRVADLPKPLFSTETRSCSKCGEPCWVGKTTLADMKGQVLDLKSSKVSSRRRRK